MADLSVKVEGHDTKSHRPNAVVMDNVPLSAWKICDSETLLKQVQIKEQAVQNGMMFLGRLYLTFENNLLLNPTCQWRMEKIIEVQDRRRESTVKIGFVGTTGSGKTTIINALLGFEDLLPTSAHRASTAVVVQIAYNTSSDPDSAFAADITFVTAEEWRTELNQLFIDINVELDEDNEDDEERDNRVSDTFDKIRCVYPHIQSREKLDTMSVEELIEHPCVRDALGKTRRISHKDQSVFSSKIREFADSGDSDGGVSALWPLVKLVELYCKSTILENRIVLVDMPGNSDSNAARNVVAENYQKELSITCVVAGATRGISEKNAQELLEKFTKRNLQLDGLFSSDKLCFILTQTDLIFNLQLYIRDHPSLAALCQPNQDAISQRNSEIAAIKSEEAVIRTRRASNSKEAKALSTQLTKLKNQFDSLFGETGHTDLKRKRLTDNCDKGLQPVCPTIEQMALKSQIDHLKSQVVTIRQSILHDSQKLEYFGRRLNTKKEAIAQEHSIIAAICIQDKNRLSTAAIERDFEHTLQEMGKKLSCPLQVFCTAAAVHLQYLTGGERRRGFPTMQSTQIGALRDWLISTTLPKRNSYAQSFLEEVDGLVKTMQPWICDTTAFVKMTEDDKKAWKLQFESSISGLKQGLLELSISSTESMKRLVATRLYSKLPQAERQGLAKSKKTVEKWANELKWNTHRSINRASGKWVDSRRKEHNWNEELSLDLTKPLLRSWQETFFEKTGILGIFQAHAEEAEKLIVDFCDKKIDPSICPKAIDGIIFLQKHIEGANRLVVSENNIAIEEYKKAMKKTHRRAGPAIKEFLSPTYMTCGSESGRGHFLRNKQTHQNMMNSRGLQMHRTGITAVRTEIDKLLDSVTARLITGYEVALAHIQEGEKSFIEQYGASDPCDSSRRDSNAGKIKLYEDAMVHFRDLETYWQTKVPPRAPQTPMLRDAGEDDAELFDVIQHQVDDDSEYEDDGGDYDVHDL